MTSHEFFEKYWLVNGKHPEVRDIDKHWLDLFDKIAAEDPKDILFIKGMNSFSILIKPKE